ncbi:unannotated protein [freshwater metagenome]|uniref:Unannotated protein n=1 Tax=freshwater metagenome TaxID=449393 RepID=A0A6J6VU52_9ZZZZ
MAGARFVHWVAPAVQATDGGLLARRLNDDVVAGAQPSAAHHTRLPTEVGVLAALGSDDPLHVHPCTEVSVHPRLEVLEERKQRWTDVPRYVLGPVHHVVAEQC